MTSATSMVQSVQPQAVNVIPHGGPAIAIFVAGLFVAVVGAMVAMEKERRPIVWAITGFVATIVAASAVLVVL